MRLAVLVCCVAGLAWAGCGKKKAGASRPTDKQISTAYYAWHSKEWTGRFNVKVLKVSVKSKYVAARFKVWWNVKRVTGGGYAKFVSERDCKLKKNDFKEWKVVSCGEDNNTKRISP